MSESLKIKGRLIKVSDRIQKTKTFIMRIFAIETEGMYPNKIKFQLNNDRCDLIDPVKIGEDITVHFDIRGNEWEGKIYNNLIAWKIDRQVAAATKSPPIQAENDFPDEEDGMPF